MKKKLLSLFMACAMALSLAIPAFATDPYYTASETDTDSLAQSVEFTVTTFVPTIDLAIPVLSDNPVVLNPYKLTYEGSDNTLNGQEVGEDADKTKQVISPVYAITNKTNVALKFTVSATTALGSNASFTFDNKHVKLSETAKKAFIQLVFKKTENATAAPGNDTAAVQTLDVNNKTDYEAIILGVGKKDSDKTLKRLAASPVDTNGEPTGNYLLFQFQGSLSRTPETGWTADDIFTTNMVFTFTPEGNQDYNANVQFAVSTPTTVGDLGDALKTDTTVTTHTAAADKKVTFAADPSIVVSTTDPGWAIISGGAYGATLGTDTDAGKLIYPKTIGSAVLTANGTYKDYVVVGFNDQYGVPKTVGLTITIVRSGIA
ncbi:MAG: hypothetical protein IJQ81_06470 [Oscillibacter sp.]|nr:hypothetical protein [Oscillibacter sp.]